VPEGQRTAGTRKVQVPSWRSGFRIRIKTSQGRKSVEGKINVLSIDSEKKEEWGLSTYFDRIGGGRLLIW